MLAAAVDYIGQGWHVIPLHSIVDGHCSCGKPACDKSAGKHPRITSGPGHRVGSLDETQVRQWWQDWPNANVGIVTGIDSDLLVLDVDGDKGEASLATLEARFGSLPATAQTRTGSGGRHILFHHPGGRRIPNRTRFLPNLDIRGDGGLIVAPPSLHYSGARYAWWDTGDPAPANWLIQILDALDAERKPPPPPPTTPRNVSLKDRIARASAYLAKCQGAVSGSAGHSQTFSVAVALVRGFDLNPDLAYDLLLHEFNPRCSPPWSEKELRHKIDDAQHKADQTTGFLLDARPRPGPLGPAPVRSLRAPEPPHPGNLSAPPGPVRAPPNPPGPDLPVIIISTEEARICAEAEAALATNPDLYQRSAFLVRVIQDGSDQAGVSRPRGVPIIALAPAPVVRSAMAATASWVRFDKRSKAHEPAHPPEWAIQFLVASRNWPHVRHLHAVVDTPILRPDGSVLDSPGYDPDTHILYIPTSPCDPVPLQPSPKDARKAADALLDVVCDFPFEQPEHRSAWLAAVLSPFARYAYPGPTPLFLFDANVRGTGKTLLARTAIAIAAASEPSLAVPAGDDDEWRKRITSIAMNADRIVFIDNVRGSFGSVALDGALTSTTWTDRLLGSNQTFSGPLLAVWFATGNNVQLAGDLVRRICHVRIEATQENPEDRSDFKHPDLHRFVQNHRPLLAAAALTILRAYCVAGSPQTPLPPWGSYEGWSDLIRQTIVWLGLPDPAATRKELADFADASKDALASLLDAWQTLDPLNHGLTPGQVIKTAHDYPGAHPDLEAALADFCPARGADKLSPRRLAAALAAARKRIVANRYFDRNPKHTRSGNLWFVAQCQCSHP